METPFQEVFPHEQYPKRARSATGRAGEGKAEPLTSWHPVWHRRQLCARGGQALQASFHLGALDDGRATGLYWVMRRFNRGRKLADEFLLLRFRPRG